MLAHTFRLHVDNLRHELHVFSHCFALTFLGGLAGNPDALDKRCRRGTAKC